MSVRVGDRKEGKMTVIDAAKDLVKYTHDRVKDNFKKKQEKEL